VLELATYFYISKTFDSVGKTGLAGAPDYFAFAAVGVVLSLVLAAASDGLSRRVREEQLSGSLEALMAQPLSPAQLCFGFTAFPFVYAVVRAALYLLIAAVVMNLDLGAADWSGVALVFIASGAALSSLGILAGAAVLVWKRGHVVAGVLVYVMTLLGGAVFPVSALPGWLQSISAVLPLRYAYDGLRDAMFRGEGWAAEVLALGGFAIVGIPLAVWVFSRALHAARRAGSIGEY
jgi:ABC-type multidrug transport system permease subunit